MDHGTQVHNEGEFVKGDLDACGLIQGFNSECILSCASGMLCPVDGCRRLLLNCHPPVIFNFVNGSHRNGIRSDASGFRLGVGKSCGINYDCEGPAIYVFHGDQYFG